MGGLLLSSLEQPTSKRMIEANNRRGNALESLGCDTDMIRALGNELNVAHATLHLLKL